MKIKKNNNKKMTVLGGGITGLMMAYFAAKDGWKVTVLEGSDKMGGLLNTFSIGGTQLEFYYHHFFTHDKEIAWMCRELGIENKLKFRNSTMGVFKNNKIYNFTTPLDLLRFTPLNLLDKVRFILSSGYLARFAKWEKMEDVAAIDWLSRYAGKNTTDALWRPLLKVKFGPYADKVPIAWMVGRLSQRLNSRRGGDEKLGYLDGSLQVLLNALLQRLQDMGVQLQTNTKITKCTIIKNTMTSVTTTKGIYKGGIFISTIPTMYLAALLQKKKPAYAKKLKKIEYFGAVCMILEMKKRLGDVYWLNIADEGYPFGGIIEHTNLIPASEYNGNYIAYFSRYFSRYDDIAKMSNKEIEMLMKKYIKKIYPNFSMTDIKKTYVFKTNTAATVCDLNFSKKVPNCTTPIKNLYIVSMPHIYPDERSTNNSIRIAAEACKIIGIDASMVPYGASLSGKIGMV